MLYHLHEQQRILMAPIIQYSHAISKLFTQSGLLSYSPFSQRIGAGFELLHRLGKNYEKPRFDILSTLVGKLEVEIKVE